MLCTYTCTGSSIFRHIRYFDIDLAEIPTHTHTHTHTHTQPTQQRCMCVCMCVFVCACVGFHMTHRIKGVSEKQAIWRSRKRDLFFSCKMYRIPHNPCPASFYNLREQIGLGIWVKLYINTELDIMSSV